MAYNPRFPHTLKVIRPELDGYGEVVFDENGDPTYHVLELDKVLFENDDWETGEPLFDRNGRPLTEKVDHIEWGYRTSTGGFRDSGDVAEADFKISTPMFTTPLNTGDFLEMTDYDRTWRMEVLKKTTYNWGSNIWVKDVKN